MENERTETIIPDNKLFFQCSVDQVTRGTTVVTISDTNYTVSYDNKSKNRPVNLNNISNKGKIIEKDCRNVYADKNQCIGKGKIKKNNSQLCSDHYPFRQTDRSYNKQSRSRTCEKRRTDCSLECVDDAARRQS